MATNASASPNYAFQKLQLKLNDIVGEDTSPTGLTPNINALAALLGADNLRGKGSLKLDFFKKDRPQDTTGKPELKVRYRKGHCNYTDDLESVDVCASPAVEASKYAHVNVTIDKQFSDQFALNKEQFRNVDEDPDMEMVLEMTERMDDMIVRMNDYMIAQIYAQAGVYPGTSINSSTDPLLLPILSTNGNYQPLAFEAVNKHYKTNGFKGRPIMLGGTLLGVMETAGALQGLGNFTVPVATPKLKLAIYEDYNLDGVIGGDSGVARNAVAWMPGTLQIMEYSDYKGIFAVNRELKKASVVNYKGFTFDVCLYIDNCTEKITCTITKWADLFYPTAQMYADCWSPGILAYGLEAKVMDDTFINNNL